MAFQGLKKFSLYRHCTFLLAFILGNASFYCNFVLFILHFKACHMFVAIHRCDETLSMCSLALGSGSAVWYCDLRWGLPLLSNWWLITQKLFIYINFVVVISLNLTLLFSFSFDFWFQRFVTHIICKDFTSSFQMCISLACLQHLVPQSKQC